MLSLKRKYDLIIRLLFAVLLLALTVYGIYKLNIYLKNENLLIYATGSNEKAFLNSTWKMSPKEIERANKTSLIPDNRTNVSAHDFVDDERYKYKVSKANLWGRDAKIYYLFFDNKLYEYEIRIEKYYITKLPDVIVGSLRDRFGTEDEAKLCNTISCLLLPEYQKKEDIIIDIKGKDLIISRYEPMNIIYNWETEDLHVYLWFLYEDETHYYVSLDVKYLPYINQIKKMSEKEKESYF